MASASGDSMEQYFRKGADVEISSNDDGFRGSWYAGTVIRPPRNSKKSSAKVLVEYKTLMEEEEGTRRLREELELVQLRPPPPRERGHNFKSNEEVDAYYSDGWWEGIITEVVGDKYLVFFRGTREQIAFKASELRLHREWVSGKWVPPLEPPDVKPMNEENRVDVKYASKKIDPSPSQSRQKKEELPSSAKVEAKREMIEYSFSSGEDVEVSSDEEGFEGAWFAATVVHKLKKGKYLIEYKNLRNDDDTKFLRETVDSLHIRPCPPDVGLIDRFEVLEEVDAWYNDGWWFGVVSKVLKNDRYSVYFRTTQEEMKFKHSDLRVHQEWRNGNWVIASKAVDL